MPVLEENNTQRLSTPEGRRSAGDAELGSKSRRRSLLASGLQVCSVLYRLCSCNVMLLLEGSRLCNCRMVLANMTALALCHQALFYEPQGGCTPLAVTLDKLDGLQCRDYLAQVLKKLRGKRLLFSKQASQILHLSLSFCPSSTSMLSAPVI